ncbi:MAG: amidohydrolase [Deltaproteobacteria bacterium]|nr:amidohydrolase [Deltaproteobacteria bacterium]
MANPPAHGSPPVLYTNANVVTLDPAQPQAAAILIEGDRIKQVYARPPAERPAAAVVIDLEGATVVPGLVDAHLHLDGMGSKQRQIDLVGTASEAEVLARVRSHLQANPGSAPVIGFGWDQNDWQRQEYPARANLDAVAGSRPVVLYRIDGHAAWLSTAALALGGVGRETKEPAGGRILRLADGEPSGILVDQAIELVTGRLPAPSREQLENDYAAAAARCAALGLTAVHDMGMTRAGLEALRALERRSALPIRVFAYQVVEGDHTIDQLPASGVRRSVGLIEVRGIKLYADGALGSRGAALLQPYSDDPGNSGLLVTEPKLLTELVRRVDRRRHQVAIHAIGDRGNQVAIEALAALGRGASQRRHRIEHAQVLAARDIAAFGRLGIVASMQPTHATSDMPWAEARLGKKRLAGAYAWRPLLDAGAHLAFGSDAPVESADPRWGLFAAVYRTDHRGQPAGGWWPEHRLDRRSALEAFTVGAAFAVQREDELGRIKPGFLADLTVLDRDPLADSVDLLALKVRRTIVGGREVVGPRAAE